MFLDTSFKVELYDFGECEGEGKGGCGCEGDVGVKSISHTQNPSTHPQTRFRL